MRTIALRFRDFGADRDRTDRGRTLKEHSALIESKGYTWWGWWKKSYESLPTQVLRELMMRAPLEIFLLDTGGVQDGFHLYPAQLEDIAVTPTGMEIQSPDVSATPTYYNTQRHAAWFKLIKLMPERIRKPSELKLLSLPTLPSTDPDVSLYQNRAIFSQYELRRLDVTLWHIEIEL